MKWRSTSTNPHFAVGSRLEEGEHERDQFALRALRNHSHSEPTSLPYNQQNITMLKICPLIMNQAYSLNYLYKALPEKLAISIIILIISSKAHYHVDAAMSSIHILLCSLVMNWAILVCAAGIWAKYHLHPLKYFPISGPVLRQWL